MDPEGKLTAMGIYKSGISESSFYCGYIRFPKNPFKHQKGYDGLLTYIPAHGGLTYGEEDWDGSMVYGFDCGHAFDSEKSHLKDRDWLSAHCEMIGHAIMIAVQYEDRYMAAKTDEHACKLLDEMTAEMKEKAGLDFEVQDNFGAMLAMLGGGPKSADLVKEDQKKRREKRKEDLGKEDPD
jgi:hypothetical protein